MTRPLVNALCAYALCAAALAGYASLYSLIEKKSAVVARLEDQITIKTEDANRAASVRASLGDIESDETTIRSYFVPETGVVAFINELETQGTELGAAIDVLSVSMSNEDTEPTLVFAVAIEGDFDAVMRTVGVIEFAPYALSLSNLSLHQRAKGTWRANVNFLVGSTPARAPAPAA